MIPKRILVPARLRRPPATGWSWVDRRFVREHMDHLSREAVLLYFFLAAVADKHGLSFYGDGTLATLLRMTLPALIQARDELLARDLIAHETRVDPGALPAAARPAPPLASLARGLMQLGEILRQATAPPHVQRGKELAMNVALWAEIRRLAEIEKLSGRAIARRLHCSRHTVAAALELDQPPGAKCRAAPASWTRTGPRSTPCWPSIPNSRRCASARRSLAAPMAIPAAPASIRRYLRHGPSRTRSRLPGSPLRAGPGDAGRLGRMRPRAGRRHDTQGLGVRGRALL